MKIETSRPANAMPAPAQNAFTKPSVSATGTAVPSATASSVVDTAISRYKAFNKLREELDRTRQQLEDRKLIDRARGILMKEKGLTEEAAYALMRSAAMRDNLKISQVAQSVITAARLLR